MDAVCNKDELWLKFLNPKYNRNDPGTKVAKKHMNKLALNFHPDKLRRKYPKCNDERFMSDCFAPINDKYDREFQ